MTLARPRRPEPAKLEQALAREYIRRSLVGFMEPLLGADVEEQCRGYVDWVVPGFSNAIKRSFHPIQFVSVRLKLGRFVSAAKSLVDRYGVSERRQRQSFFRYSSVLA